MKVVQYPIPLGQYRDSGNADFDADAVAGEIIQELAQLIGGTVNDWETPKADRHLGAVVARLKAISKNLNDSTAIVWIGHGDSQDHSAHLIVPGLPDDGDVTMRPEAFAEHLVTQSQNRPLSGPPTWTLVLIEACGAGRFVELVNAHLMLTGRVKGVLLVGVGDPHGRGHAGTAAKVLRQALQTVGANTTRLRWSDLREAIAERLEYGALGKVGDCGADGYTFERPSQVISAPLDIYPRLRQALDALPTDQQRHFGPKGLGADFGELAWRFVGRSAERALLVEHLTEGTGLLAVTGAAGSGKSAVIGNVLLRAQPEIHELLLQAGLLDDEPAEDTPPLTVTEWVHLSGLTLREAIDRIAMALGLDRNLEHTDEEAQRALLGAVQDRAKVRLVLDALDESRDPVATAALARRLAASGATLVVGTRPSRADRPDAPKTDGEDLLQELGVAAVDCLWIERDPDALRVYLERGLDQIAEADPGAACTANPALRSLIIEAVCTPNKAADQAERQFLYARLLLAELSASPLLSEEALRELLRGNHRDLFAAAVTRLGRQDPSVPVLLQALSAARGNGAPRLGSVWATIADALGATASPEEIDRCLELAAPYLAISAEHGQEVFRLAHRTFQEHFDAAWTAERKAEVARALIRLADATWEDLNPYLVAYLAEHVADGAQWDALVTHQRLLDAIDPYSVTREVMRTLFGRRPIPPELAGVLAAAPELRTADPKDRQGIRQLTTASYTSAPPPTHDPNTWSVAASSRTRRTPHLRLTGHTGGVTASASFTTADGHARLATASRDGTVRIWDPATGRSDGSPLPTGRVNSIASFTTATGHPRLATGGADGTVLIWDPATPEPVGPLNGPTGWVTAITSFTTADGHTRLATGSRDHNVRIWDPATRSPARGPFPGHTDRINAIASFTTATGHPRLATGSADGTVLIWDPATGQSLGGPLHGHTDWVITVSPFTAADGHVRLATGSADGTVLIWDPSTSQSPVATLHGHTGWVTTVSPFIAADGHVLIATGSDDGTVRIWDPATGRPVGGPLPGHTGWVTAIAPVTTADGHVLIATGSDDYTLRIWAPTTSRPVRSPLPGHTDWVTAIAPFTTAHGHTRLATGSRDRTVRIWDPATGRPVGGPLPGHTGWVTAIARFTTADGRPRLATCCGPQASGENGSVLIWDPATRQRVDAHLPCHNHWITTIASFTTSDGQACLATGSRDGTVLIWDPATRQPIGEPLPTGLVNAIAPFTTADGHVRLASGSRAGTVLIWDPATRQPIGEPLPTGWVNAIAALTTQDGHPLLATSSRDRTVLIWDPSVPVCPIVTLTLGTTPGALSALPDGTLLVGLEDGWARIRLPASLLTGQGNTQAESN